MRRDKLLELIELRKPTFRELRESLETDEADNSKLADLIRDFMKIGNLKGKISEGAIRRKIEGLEKEQPEGLNPAILWLYYQRFKDSATLESMLGFPKDLDNEREDALAVANSIGVSLASLKKIQKYDEFEKELLDRLVSSGIMLSLLHCLYGYAMLAGYADISIKSPISSPVKLDYEQSKDALFDFLKRRIETIMKDTADLYKKEREETIENEMNVLRAEIKILELNREIEKRESDKKAPSPDEEGAE